MIVRMSQLFRVLLQITGDILSKLYAKVLLLTVIRRYNGVVPHTPKIFVVNHPNTLDPFYLLGILQERVVILITEHVFHIPVLGRLVRRAGHIEVTQSGHDVYLQAKRAILQGKSLLIFAEGAISYTPNRIRSFHTGPVRLSMETGAPIIPIGIHVDAAKIWKKRAEIKHSAFVFTWYRYGWYTVVFGKPIFFVGTTADHARVRLHTVSLRQQVISCVQQGIFAQTEEALLHKRTAKRSFHVALRGVYKFVCFVGFILFKLNEVGIKILG